MDQRKALYEYLRQKSGKQQDPMQDAYRLSDAGNLLGSFSEAASMAGQLQGKRAQSDIIPQMSKDLYQTSMDAAKADQNLEDRQLKRLQLMEELSPEGRMLKEKYRFEPELRSPEGDPVMMSETGKYQRLPGFKVQQKPSAGIGQILTGYEKPGYVLERRPDGQLVERALPSGFKTQQKKSETLTESERKSGLQAAVAAQELKRLEQIESEYTPGARDLMTNLVPEAIGGNYLKTSQQQQYSAANKALADVMLRTKSGANFTRDEMIAQIESYSFQPGDSEQTKADKKSRRAEFVNAMIQSGGRGTAGMELIDSGSDQPIGMSPEQRSRLEELRAKYRK